MEIHIIRHTPVNIVSGTCYGQSNVPIDLEMFQQYVKRYTQSLNKEYELIISSPLNRCTDLAKHLQLGEYKTDNRLMEMNFGDWELKEWKNIPLQQSDCWMNEFDQLPTPNGESMKDLYNRVLDFYNDLKKEKYKNVLIITHAGVIRCFWAILLEISLKNTMKIPIGFGEIFSFETDYETIIKKA